ncbi:unnamed protein product [Phaedon cochleariae]|uniref:Uncharacterized protein n=1 Tax=Phaedon cochleariae TaxID=80249 RepID=A0A9P0DN08_PHACE|nr:unnamed protein product [Phaedon cochleariae]
MAFPLSYYILPTFLLLFIIRKVRESKWGKCKNNVQLDGKTAIVTGANSGIGFEIARELAQRKAHVIVACRTLEKAREACLQIHAKLKSDQAVLIPMEVNLASLKSIKNFAEEVNKNHEEINILVNNAGVSFPNSQRMLTEDKFEIHFGVNYLAHFYLTSLLLKLLSIAPSRVIVVASSLHERGEINLSDLNHLHSTKKTNLYANSKLANVYFAQELARRIESNHVRVYACCPGWVYTGLFRHSLKWYHYILIAPVAFFFMRSAKQGAQTPIYCATESSIENETGLLYRDCKPYNSKAIFYDNVGIKLWEQSQQMINDATKEL